MRVRENINGWNGPYGWAEDQIRGMELDANLYVSTMREEKGRDGLRVAPVGQVTSISVSR